MCKKRLKAAFYFLKKTIGSVRTAAYYFVVKTVFRKTGRVFMNNDLGAGVDAQQGRFDGIGIFMGLVQTQVSVQFQMKFEHKNTAQIAGAQIMNAFGKIMGQYDFLYVQSDFFAEFFVCQQSQGIARQLVRVVYVL